jgi:hypothetical protein
VFRTSAEKGNSCDVGLGVGVDPEEGSYQRFRRRVRRCRQIRIAATRQPVDIGRVLRQARHETRLADAGRSDDLDGRTVAASGLGQRLVQSRQLRVPTDEQSGVDTARAFGSLPAQGQRPNRRALSLCGKRLDHARFVASPVTL